MQTHLQRLRLLVAPRRAALRLQLRLRVRRVELLLPLLLRRHVEVSARQTLAGQRRVAHGLGGRQGGGLLARACVGDLRAALRGHLALPLHLRLRLAEHLRRKALAFLRGGGGGLRVGQARVGSLRVADGVGVHAGALRLPLTLGDELGLAGLAVGGGTLDVAVSLEESLCGCVGCGVWFWFCEGLCILV